MKTLARAAGTILALVMLGCVLLRFDWSALARVKIDGRIVLVLLPSMIALALDTLAWRRLLRVLGHRVSFFDLVPVRIVSEAITLALPAGAGVSESIVPSLVHARTGISRIDALSSSVAKRWTVMHAHAIYVVLGGVLGFIALRAISPILPWIVIASALLPLASSFAMRGALARGIGARIHRWLKRGEDSLRQVDRSFIALAGAHDVVPTLQILLAWLCESLEAFVILRLLGAPATIPMVLALEAGLSVVRSAAFFAPAGLGVQDLGYVHGFEAYGWGDVAGAFVILKRSRELLITIVGFAVLALVRKQAPVRDHCGESATPRNCVPG